LGGDKRGKMSSFPDPLELEQVDEDWKEHDPNVFDRVTAVPGEVAPAPPPDGSGGGDDPISGLHQRTTPDAGIPSFREPLPDDDLPPVLGPAPSGRSRPKTAKPAESKSVEPPRSSRKPTPSRGRRQEPWKSTGARRTGAPKRPVLELELEDIEATRPEPGPRPDALEVPLPERAPVSLPIPVSRPQVSPELLDMRDRYATGDFTGALVVAESLLETAPDHEEARRCLGRCTEVLSQMYMARLGSPAQAVRVAVPNDQIRWLSLDHRAGFLLSLVDGRLTIDELLDISGMPRLDALRILFGLLDQRVIALCERT
jgi:hypothetical protein